MGAWIETIKDVVCQMGCVVAPYVGAWIETYKLLKMLGYGLSHPMWVRGLKLTMPLKWQPNLNVAPYVGAWIETYFEGKPNFRSNVAPYVGAWIETDVVFLDSDVSLCRTLCGCVD